MNKKRKRKNIEINLYYKILQSSTKTKLQKGQCFNYKKRCVEHQPIS